MNPYLQEIKDFITQAEKLSVVEKAALETAVKKIDNEIAVTAFMLDRTEKVKRTTAILLEETIEELEQKRKAVEATYRELEIESSLERVRTVAMSMGKPDDMLLVCRMISEQLESLHVSGIRNVQTAIIDETADTYMNYEFYPQHDRSFVTEVNFNLHSAQLEFVQQMLKGPEEFFSKSFAGVEVQEWYAYQQTTDQFADPLLATADSLNYYWYSMGAVALGMSTYRPLSEDETILFKRFRNVFEMAFRRFKDIEKAEAQALLAEENLLKIQTEKQRAEEALSELQITQKQLIQSEKMASLGELTAGIAHEIQNPLNFVNNFSEVSTELLDEMIEEVEKGNYDEVKDIAGDVKQNLEKINHHGKRADSIVKGMLQHSRSSSGKKEPTDINALCDEYLRLSYHGLRAKDKSFNATIKTAFDESIGTVDLLPQEMGRVILNLLTNAFYAVNEKKKTVGGDYDPTVTIGTKKMPGGVEIQVEDNGSGIPQASIDKIFQPFFTTKPTGQGTGLGLSMSYDIVTKGHNGTIAAEGASGGGTIFKIHLPQQKPMDKNSQLTAALDRVVNIGFGLEPEDEVEKYFSDRLLVIGTAVNERYDTLDGLRHLIRMQKEQAAGMEVTFTRKEFYRDVLEEANIAIVAEDIAASIKIGADTIRFDVRSTNVMQYGEAGWKLIHWHASKPDPVQAEDDTFGVEEWKQKAKELEALVAERTADLRVKNEELLSAVENLKATQSQLIQSEKMASLGELTAGIAHEIQNPLNFVNNFSEVSNELIDEMREELATGNTKEAIEIGADIKSNLEKIAHHGKRADAIVKGMLQHSRSSTGQKELTDINTLCDEYLRLAYHGLRAKDKSFNAAFTTDFDPAIGKINIVPQDIGRVILNLITNAFYSTDEKKKSGIPEYEPAVKIVTKGPASSEGKGGVLIKVADNGNGIPTAVLSKIFQPFFTTKPTGKGTGLGLSMSYDIIQAHGGNIEVETEEGNGTTFIIALTAQQ